METVISAIKDFLFIGDGDGSGYGSGYGNGSGIKSVNGMAVYSVDGVATIITRVRGNAAKGFILYSDLSMHACYIVKGNNMFAHGSTLREARDALAAKMFDDMDAEERIAEFWKEFKLGVKYPNSKFFDWHHRLTGSCEMGRASFARDHGIDVENGNMTVEEFIALTKNAYGGDIIQQLLKH